MNLLEGLVLLLMFFIFQWTFRLLFILLIVRIIGRLKDNTINSIKDGVEKWTEKEN